MGAMFKQIRFLVLCAAILIAGGCGQSDEAPSPEMQRYTFKHNESLREYFVFLPSSYDGERELPVAIFMHGYGGTATGTEAEVTQGLNQYAEEYGYVMVYPQSTWFMSSADGGEPWEVTSWNHISDGFDTGPAGPICTEDATRYPCPPECGDCGRCGWTSCHDDVGFLKNLIDLVVADFAVTEDRIFVAGFSNGAMMANRFGCEAAGRIPADGSRSESGYFFASTTSITKFWTDGAACAADPQSWVSPVVSQDEARCTIACADSAAPVIDCLWPEGNHRWPGTADFRGSNGYCVTKLQAASMPDQTICIPPEKNTNFWGSRLLFEFFRAVAHGSV
jgi:poly(3-hydroxybutyrate) depolymerase